MSFDGIHVLRGKPGIDQRLADDTLLRKTVRCRQALAFTVLINRGTFDQRQYRVTVALGIGHTFQ